MVIHRRRRLPSDRNQKPPPAGSASGSKILRTVGLVKECRLSMAFRNRRRWILLVYALAMATVSFDKQRHIQNCGTRTNALKHATKNMAHSQGVTVHGATVMARMSGCLKRVHNKTPTAGKIQARYLFRIRPLREYKCSSYQDARVLCHITQNKAHRKAFWVLALLAVWKFDFTVAKKCPRPALSSAETAELCRLNGCFHRYTTSNKRAKHEAYA